MQALRFDFKQWREDMGNISQETAANALGVSLRQYGDWERARQAPDKRTIHACHWLMKVGVSGESTNDAEDLLDQITDLIDEYRAGKAGGGL